MKKDKIILLSSVVAVALGLGAATVNADTNINAAKYVESVQNLQKTFTDKNKGFSLNEIEVENNKDNSRQPVYKLEGFNKDKTKEVKMKVNADKTSDVIKNKTKKMDSDDKKDAIKINVDDVKKSPKDAIELAKKYANEKNDPVEWSLEMDKVNGKEEPVYKVKFETNKHSEKTVKLNAIDGNKISVKNDD